MHRRTTSRTGTWLVGALCACAVAVVAPAPARAQQASRLDLGGVLEVGAEGERYLRALQAAGLAPLIPSLILPYTPAQARQLLPSSPHPWAAAWGGAGQATGIRLLRPRARVIANSAFPVQVDGGPTWSGRGVTADVQAGVLARWNRVTLQLAPSAFAAQNAAFDLAPNGQQGEAVYGDARFPLNIDAPQRYGSEAYARIDLGTSVLSIDFNHVSFGASTAPQRWGPALDYPLVLGPNAGGFPHLFIGTNSPVNLWVARLSTRLLLGTLQQSRVFTAGDADARRFASGLAVAFTVRGVPGLEIGASRFFEGPAPGGGIGLHEALLPFGGFITTGTQGLNRERSNQVASAFARWVLPRAGAEFYAELYREDYAGNFRWFLEKPDDLVSYTIGMQQVVSATPARVRTVRAEIVNGETSHHERGQRGFRGPIPPYTHGSTFQGHTQRGLILGSPEAFGGAGWRVRLDDYTPGGRRSFAIERRLRFDWLPGPDPTEPVHPDIVYAVTGGILRVHGTREWGVTVTPALNLNRNLRSGDHVFNLTAAVSVRGFR